MIERIWGQLTFVASIFGPCHKSYFNHIKSSPIFRLHERNYNKNYSKNSVNFTKNSLELEWKLKIIFIFELCSVSMCDSAVIWSGHRRASVTCQEAFISNRFTSNGTWVKFILKNIVNDYYLDLFYILHWLPSGQVPIYRTIHLEHLLRPWITMDRVNSVEKSIFK